MTTEEKIPPAFPVVANNVVYSTGMSLRDWFASQALSHNYTANESDPNKAAEWAYQIADAMLGVRDK